MADFIKQINEEVVEETIQEEVVAQEPEVKEEVVQVSNQQMEEEISKGILSRLGEAMGFTKPEPVQEAEVEKAHEPNLMDEIKSLREELQELKGEKHTMNVDDKYKNFVLHECREQNKSVEQYLEEHPHFKKSHTHTVVRDVPQETSKPAGTYLDKKQENIYNAFRAAGIFKN
jgi:acetoin utilization deacetylase AcuC-like enzyme